MIIDSSAVIAILKNEPGSRRLNTAIAAATDPRMSSTTWAETSIVCLSKGLVKSDAGLHSLPQVIGFRIVPFTEKHAAAAGAAFEKFGRGRHPARLNFGDCMSYATAKLAGEPLLYVGDDFAQTDIEAAL